MSESTYPISDGYVTDCHCLHVSAASTVTLSLAVSHVKPALFTLRNALSDFP